MYKRQSLSCRVAAVVPDTAIAEALALAPLEARGDERRYAKGSRIGVLAAREAVADAGLSGALPDAGVIIGSGAGGIDVAERHYGDFFGGHHHRVSPYAIPVSTVGMVSSEISIALGLRGISHVVSTGCTSSTDAIGYATSLIRSGDADVLVTGGADACVTPGMMMGFSRMRVLSVAGNDRPAEASKPFDAARDGFVLGEGAWMLTLERLDRARARGARRRAGRACSCSYPGHSSPASQRDRPAPKACTSVPTPTSGTRSGGSGALGSDGTLSLIHI